MINIMTTIRHILRDDYSNGHLELYKQLTFMNPENISKNSYNEFVNKLNENHMIYVLLHEGRIVGTATIFIEEKLIRDISRVAHIEDVVIDKNCRGLGFGKLIIDHLIGIAKKRDCYKVILDCAKENQIFYEKCGLIANGYQMCKYF